MKTVGLRKGTGESKYPLAVWVKFPKYIEFHSGVEVILCKGKEWREMHQNFFMD